MKKTLVMALSTMSFLAACADREEPEVSGRAVYQDYCVTCHGVSGRGDGPAAGGLAQKPADLTRITARNGGTFPQVRVMSVIDGYTRRDQHGTTMPEMGPVLQEGRLVVVDTGDGVMTPTPERLVALADYLESIQR